MPETSPIVVIDPGHGGATAAGGSSPNNVRGPNGLLEKDLSLDLARRVEGLLAGAAAVYLTRTGDRNLALSERARLARERDAAAFVSLHFNGVADPGVDGTDVWVARNASPHTRALADTLLERVASVTGAARGRILQRDLGVLLSSRHAPRTAACLVEVAHLTNPQQARRLEAPEYRQQLAAAVADALRRHLPAATTAGAQALRESPQRAPGITDTGRTAERVEYDGGRPHVPAADATRFRCAPTPVSVATASLLPAPTTNPDAAIRTALQQRGVSPAGITTFEGAGGFAPLRAIAGMFGAAALTELLQRLRYSPAQITSPPHTHGARLTQSLGVHSAAEILAPRLLLTIPGHFRELARRAADAREAHALECFGWLVMQSLQDQVRAATGKSWWTPPPPAFVSPFASTLPSLSRPVQRMILASNLIDTTLSDGDFAARFNTWNSGLAGRQWQFETAVAAASPGAGRPFYTEIVTVPAAINITAERQQIDAAWAQRLQATDAQFHPLSPQSTAALQRCDDTRLDQLRLTERASLGGIHLSYNYPLVTPARDQYARVIRTGLKVLRAIKPVFEEVFRTIYELGWNDLVFQTAGAGCFRGKKTAGANVAANAREISNHGYAIAVDLLTVENPLGTAHSTMDPRIVAVFEAYRFRWGRCFSGSPDPHHFEYCGAAC